MFVFIFPEVFFQKIPKQLTCQSTAKQPNLMSVVFDFKEIELGRYEK